MIQVYIGDEEVVSNNKFTISEEMLSTSSTILNNCYPKSWEDSKDYTSNFYYPKDYSICKILKDNMLIFAGVIKNSGNISLKPTNPKYCSLQILDFKALLSEGDTLNFVITNKTISEAISQVVDACNDYGFILGNINILNSNDKIGAYSTLNKTPYDVFQYLADISQSKWTTRLINENTLAIDFYDPTLMPQGINIEYTTEWFENNEIIDISFSYGTYDYRNKQTILSSEVYADIDYQEIILSNGADKTFTTSANIGKISSITIDGEEQTFVTQNEKELGIEADFYYKPGQNTFDTDNTIQAGKQILITYTPLVQGRQVISNENEIERIENQINRKGIISRYEDRNDVLDSQELRKVAQAYIKYKGNPEITLKVKTSKNLWNIGEVVNFDAPIDDLKKDYLVKNKTIEIITTANKIFYSYELSSNFNSENAINYFDNQRNKANGNISTGEYITRNIDIENVANIIFSNLQIEEIEVTADNVLDCALDSPFTK